MSYKWSNIIVLFVSFGLFGQVVTIPNNAPVANLPNLINTNFSNVSQKFVGTSAPGSVAGNLPGDHFIDSTNHLEYVCNAPSGTAAPACTSVTATGWILPQPTGLTLQNSGSTTGSGLTTLNVQPDSSTIVTTSVVGDTGTVKYAINTAAVPSTAIAQAGVSTVADTGASGASYAGCPTTTITALTSGMQVVLIPANASTGGATTFNLCTLGPVAVLGWGTSNPAVNDFLVNRPMILRYDSSFSGGAWVYTPDGTLPSGSVPSYATSDDLQAAHPTCDITLAQVTSDPAGQQLYTCSGSGVWTGMPSVTTAGSNTNTGVGGLPSINNGYGYYNTNTGYAGMYGIAEGSYDTNTGSFGMASLTHGSNDTNTGLGGMYYLTEGSYDTNTGAGGMNNLTTGNYNTATGYVAGSYIFDGSSPNQTSAYSTYLGQATKALADGDTDETVIGSNATGAGSHTVMLGSSTVTDVYAGSAAPTATQHALGFESDGTTFTIASGCGTPGSLVGGGTAGSFTAGQTACAPVITFTHTAPHGWSCFAADISVPTDIITQSAYTPTSCTLTGTVVSGDRIVFHAMAF